MTANGVTTRAIGLFWFLMAALAALPATAGALHDGVAYRRGLELDIHAPGDGAVRAGLPGVNLFAFASGRKLAPVVIYAHGGGWVKGSRKKVYALPQWLNAKGYMLVAIDYRKVPATTIDGQVQDLAAAVA